MSSITDVQIHIPDGPRGSQFRRSEASFRYYGLTIRRVAVVENTATGEVNIRLPEYHAWHNKSDPIVEAAPMVEAQIKTAILRAYRAAVARKEAA